MEMIGLWHVKHLAEQHLPRFLCPVVNHLELSLITNPLRDLLVSDLTTRIHPYLRTMLP